MCPGLFQAPARSTCPNEGTLIIASRITPQPGIDLIIFMFVCSVKFMSDPGRLQKSAAVDVHHFVEHGVGSHFVSPGSFLNWRTVSHGTMRYSGSTTRMES